MRRCARARICKEGLILFDQNNPADNRHSPGNGDDIRQKLIDRFVEYNSDICDDISRCIRDGDTDTARRRAHTLKSNAGQLELSALQNAAETVEHLLKDGKDAAEQVEILRRETEKALARLTPLVSAPVQPVGSISRRRALELLAKAEALLEEYDTDCMELVNDLRLIPGSEELVRQIEDFSFEQALAEAGKLKAKF